MKTNKWFNASKRRCYAFKQGCSDRFASVLRIDENGTLSMVYFIDSRNNNKLSGLIQNEFTEIMYKYFKCSKNITVIDEVYRLAKQDIYRYEVQYYSMLIDNKNIPSNESMEQLKKELEGILTN